MARFLVAKYIHWIPPYRCSTQPLSDPYAFRRPRWTGKKRLLASPCQSVCLSVRPYGTTRFPMDEIS